MAGRIPRPSPRQVLFAGLAVIAALGLLWQRCGLLGCPDVDRLVSYQPAGAPELLDGDGEVFGRLAPVDHELVPLDSIPPHVVEAFVAVEDRRFREHEGVDWWRAAGALLANLRAGEAREGFSTLTMQLARNAFPERLPQSDRSLRRKLLEIRVAQAIERRFSKDEILELYLNHIYFGQGAWGITSAARRYFGRAPSRLSVGEGALLAALPKAPSHYDPLKDPGRARERTNLVLDLMETQGRLTPEQARAARDVLLVIRRRPTEWTPEPRVAPYFTDVVRRTLEAKLGSRLYTQRLRVRTTLDRRLQEVLEDETERQLRLVEGGAYGRFQHPRYRSRERPEGGATPYLQAASVVLDPRSGEVLALVGGRDARHSAFDRATRARRPMGSAFKAFVAATALESGRTPLTTIEDTPLSIETDEGPWEPRNFGGRFRGRVTLRESMVHSINVATVRLARDVGLRRVARGARRLGIREAREPHPSLALGAVEASPLEVAAAYSAFAAGGVRPEPRVVRAVEDAGGRVLWTASERRREVLRPEVAFLVTDILEDAVAVGTGKAVLRRGYRGPVAGKTGTTNEGKDAWFVGYTPDLLGAFWIGFDRPTPIVDETSGGLLAAPVWGRLLSRAYRDRPLPEPWAPPEGVVELPVDRASRAVLAERCAPEGAPTEWFLEGTKPGAECPGEERPGLLGRLLGAAARMLGSRDAAASGKERMCCTRP